MKSGSIYILLFLLLLCIIEPAAQPDIIAKIGNREITTDEFKLRYELSPRIVSDDLINPDSLKLNFLYSLIAEKLWSIEATNKGISTSEEFNFYYKPIEKIYVRDELFKTEVKDKIEITQSDISKGLQKHFKILQMRILSSTDSSQIKNLYSKLIGASSTDSLINFTSNKSIESTLMEIKFGDLNDENLEDKLYNLNISEYSIPIKYEDNWFIFQLKSVKPSIPEVSQNKLETDVEEIIRNRRIRNLYNEFYKKYFGEYVLKADEKVFLKISEEFYKVIDTRIKLNSDIDTSEMTYLLESDILNVKENLGFDFLNQTIFQSNYGPVKAYDFLSDLTLVDVGFKSLSRSVINKVLSNELKRFMQQETIYLIGKNKGLNFSADVSAQLDMWKDNLLSQTLKNDYNSKIDITESEIIEYYSQVSADSLEIMEFKIQSISTQSIEEIETILNLLIEGISFEDLPNISELSSDISAENIFSLNTLKDFGLTIDIIDDLKNGDIYGPVETTRGYTIIKIIDQQSVSDSIMAEIDKVRDNIRQKLYFNKLNRLLEKETTIIANKFKITLNENLLISEQYSDINLFVHRYMGFGGRIAAVPFTTPFYKWFYQWKNKTSLNP